MPAHCWSCVSPTLVSRSKTHIAPKRPREIGPSPARRPPRVVVLPRSIRRCLRVSGAVWFRASLSKRSITSRRLRVQPLPTLHLELWVALRKDRARLGRTLRKLYGIAGRITEDGGGSGPWLFLVDPDSSNPKTARLRTILGLRPKEDLWVELAFYPNRVRMRSIIRRVWKQPGVLVNAGALDDLLSTRKAGYKATIAYAALKLV
jgi:hypothetical protein